MAIFILLRRYLFGNPQIRKSAVYADNAVHEITELQDLLANSPYERVRIGKKSAQLNDLDGGYYE